MEDDEVIGTVRQFSNHLGLAESQVVPCLREAAQSVIVQAGIVRSAPRLGGREILL